MTNILFVIGSTRKNSFNRQLANITEKLIAKYASNNCAQIQVNYLQFDNLPFFNQDIEFPTPEAVAKIRDEFSKADGIWIFTPEYNQSYPGYLKNLIDWLSRPLKKNDFSSGTVIQNKKITISGVSGKSAAGNSRKKLSELLTYVGADLFLGEGTGIALNGQSFATDTLSLTDENLEKLHMQVLEFLRFVKE
jgi:NAD(P)H-dependent FMN reductase